MITPSNDKVMSGQVEDDDDQNNVESGFEDDSEEEIRKASPIKQ